MRHALVRFAVLGPVRAWSGEREIIFRDRTSRLFLGLLLLRAGEPVLAADLVDLLWGADAPEDAPALVHGYVTRLRDSIQPVALVADRQAYRLCLDEAELDLWSFRRTVRQAERYREFDRAAELYADALDHWAGRCGAGLEPTSALHPAFVAADLERVAAAAALTRLAEKTRLPDRAVRALRRSAALDPAEHRRHENTSRPAQLPAAHRHFTGRSGELAEITDRLRPGSGSGVVAIDGLPGIGKSTLAVRWAHEAAARFPDGQLFLDLGGFGPDEPVDPGAALTVLLGALGVPAERIPAGLEAKAGLYRSTTAGRRILVVLDNAESAEQVSPLIPGSAYASVLVTSRRRLAGLALRMGAHLLTLGLPGVDEAREFLEVADGAQGAVDEVVRECGRLPLAMAIVAAQPSWRAAGAGLDAFAGDEPAGDLRTVFSWSYRRLSDAAASLFRILADQPGPLMSRDRIASAAGLDPREAGRLLGELTRVGLLAEHRPGHYLLHDLLRRYAAEADVPEREPSGPALPAHT